MVTLVKDLTPNKLVKILRDLKPEVSVYSMYEWADLRPSSITRNEYYLCKPRTFEGRFEIDRIREIEIGRYVKVSSPLVHERGEERVYIPDLMFAAAIPPHIMSTAKMYAQEFNALARAEEKLNGYFEKGFIIPLKSSRIDYRDRLANKGTLGIIEVNLSNKGSNKEQDFEKFLPIIRDYLLK